MTPREYNVVLPLLKIILRLWGWYTHILIRISWLLDIVCCLLLEKHLVFLGIISASDRKLKIGVELIFLFETKR
jgi:hypothetical protein